MANPYIVECPVCGALAGEVCHTPEGYVMPGTHEGRRRRAHWDDTWADICDTPPEHNAPPLPGWWLDELEDEDWR